MFQRITNIEKLDGGIRFDNKESNRSVISVNAGGADVTDETLLHLKVFAELRSLSLSDCKSVTDAGLVHLKRLNSLRLLFLSDSKVTDVGLVHLMAMTKLEFLDLENTKVTDAGLLRLMDDES